MRSLHYGAWWLIASIEVRQSFLSATAFEMIPTLRPFRQNTRVQNVPDRPISPLLEAHPSHRRDTRFSSHELSAVRGGGGGGDASSSTLSYYLLWSPGILVQTVASFGILMALKFSFGDLLTTSLSRLPSVVGRLLDIIVLPLLSSACCAIQLLLNVMVGASGCAGFNKHLGPLRPYFLGILLSTMVSSSVISTQRVVVPLFLAFLPEWIHLYNTAALFSRRRGSTTHKLMSDASTSIAEIELEIPGMGCVACINKINGSLQQVPGVTESDAWIIDGGGGGKAKVQCLVGSIQHAQELSTKLMTAVHNAGFDPCHVDSLELKQ